ncbi:guanine nucleotide exchange protein for ADP-robosylation factor [Blyttiomyces sp. JEL0837]|nr:guanine nucleotide exchange protein for ADP-robosylation factor [Blyttiomyces sp. JEL0837]
MSGVRTPEFSKATMASGAASADVFIRKALDELGNSKESKKYPALKEAIKQALGVLESAAVDETAFQTLFKPFLLACQSRQPHLVTIAIDCLGKLFSYNYWSRFDQGNATNNRSQTSDAGSVIAVASVESAPTDASTKVDESPAVSQIDPRGSHDEERERPSLDSNGESRDDNIDDGIIGQVVDTICDTFSGGENTDDRVQVQIVKALMAAVSGANQVSSVHGSVLLRTVRTAYNIFLLSKSSTTQIVAQASLTQMIQTVCGRVPAEMSVMNDNHYLNLLSGSLSALDVSGKSDGGSEIGEGVPRESAEHSRSRTDEPQLTMKGIDSQESFRSNVNADEKAQIINGMSRRADLKRSQDLLERRSKSENEVDECIKDAYLVFRALCKLSMKPISSPEAATDLKSHAMRSKLLSLHLIYTILSAHTNIFFTPAHVLFSASPNAPPVSVLFIHSVKQYLCLSLSRNAVSVVPQVFEISMDIFGKMLSHVGSALKKEISVFFTEIIIPIVEARSTITFHQRSALMKSLHRILSDPSADGGRLLVEIYLNYDCDLEATARENIWERLISSLSRVITLHRAPDANQKDKDKEKDSAGANASSAPGTPTTTTAGSLPPAITTATLTNLTKEQLKELYSATGDYSELKKRGLELMVRGILKPVLGWCETRLNASVAAEDGTSIVSAGASAVDNILLGDRRKEDKEPATAVTGGPASPERDKDVGGLGLIRESNEDSASTSAPPAVAVAASDNPTQFEVLRLKKMTLSEGITKFNFKPKKGIQYLLDTGCIPARTPKDIGLFLLNTEGLNKSMIGEFLGEGDDENIAIMHSFVDQMDFTSMNFVTALRTFLQHFRLPGEAQKIDRFMLKFAERYHLGNPTSFSNAETAYVLAYSVIMLNTDQHNAQVKKRMTKSDFLKNNRGIDEGKDLPAELLEAIFDEIQTNEIVLKDEKPEKPAAAASTPAIVFPGGQSSRKEVAQFTQASESMALKTEAVFNSIMRGGKRVPGSLSGTSTPNKGDGTYGDMFSPFYSATHYEHVKSMFQSIWMSVLTAISGPLQESEDLEMIVLALEGFKHAARIACLFDMELERKAFISTLAKFTQLNNVWEMKPKSLEAIKCLLELGHTIGNRLGDSWMDVVMCVSQLEKMQIVDGSTAAPQRPSVDARRRDSNQVSKRDQKGFSEEVAALASSQTMTLTVDKIFTSSARLSGPAIVTFVRALCSVSWDEITSSANSEHPRMYCLQRLVEISYYNMKRIRVEWSNIWAILGDHFNQVGCHPNTQVCFFALDKLRQLAMKFLELEELPNFKFQKDFLKPFDFVLANAVDTKVKDMALTCLQQMVQAKAKSVKSGWIAMLSALTKSARDENESIVLIAFDITKMIAKNHFESVVANLTFHYLVSCLVEFCKNKNFPKTSLQAIEVLKQAIPKIQEMSKTSSGSKILQVAALAADKTTTELLTVSGAASQISKNVASLTVTINAGSPEILSPVSGHPSDDPNANLRHIFPVLFGLYDIIMTCDLEVRTRALNYLFDTLKQIGGGLSQDSWEVVTKGVLFPIFDDLRLSRQEHSKFANKDDLSVWLSTTLIQALRLFVDLFAVFFEPLMFCVDGLLDLLTVCMTQENETLARIGSTCLQQFIEMNVNTLDAKMWDKICAMFSHLFEVTTPNSLFFDYRFQEPEMPTGVVAPPEVDEENATEIGESAAEEPAPKPEEEKKDEVVILPPEAEEPSDDVAVGEKGKAAAKKPEETAGVTSPTTEPTKEAKIEKVEKQPNQVNPLVLVNGVPDLTGRPRPQPKDFQGIIVKCVLHLLVIQTLQEVLATVGTAELANAASPLQLVKGPSDAVYRSLSSDHLFVLIDCLERSYRFARAFNNDIELRVALYRIGFMKQLPNLLKQETSSVTTYIAILIKMYTDENPERVRTRSEVERRLIPLSQDILYNYNNIDPDVKRKNVAAWRPVVVAILTALSDLDDERFRVHVPSFYEEAVNLLLHQDLAIEIRFALHSLLARTGSAFGIIPSDSNLMANNLTSPARASFVKET